MKKVVPNHARIVCAAPKGSRNWSAADDASLKDLWENSTNSAQEIGDIIGRPRCGVIGRAHRLGLQPRKIGAVILSRPVKRRAAVPPAESVKKRRITWIANAPVGIGAQIVHAATKAAEIAPEVQRVEKRGLFSGVGIRLMDARLLHCSWPYDGHAPDDPHCCGARVVREGSPYCADHAALAYPHMRAEERSVA